MAETGSPRPGRAALTTPLIREAVCNRWIQFAGGSRPDTRRLRILVAPGQEPQLQVQYVFDLETGEESHLEFGFGSAGFDALVEDLVRQGHAELTRHGTDQDFSFEWRLEGDRLEFRLKGVARDPFAGSVGLEMTSFAEMYVGLRG